MARPVRKPGDQPPDEKIMLAATDVIGELGFERASMKEIAERAGMTAGALYYHFENKQALLFQILLFAARSLVERCKTAIAGKEANPEEALRRFVGEYVLFQAGKFSTVNHVYTVWVHGLRRRKGVLTAEQRKRLGELERQHFDMLRGILMQGTSKRVFQVRDASLTAFAIIGMVEHVIHWLRPEGRYSVEQIAALYAEKALTLARVG